MRDQQVPMNNPSALLTLLNQSGETPQAWQPQELGAILRHQLQAPLPLAVGDFSTEASDLMGDCPPESPAPRNLEDLLCQTRPSPELLGLTKQFAKSFSGGAGIGLPREVALLLYYLSIAVARMRCQTRLSTLSDLALASGLQWSSAQNWLDEPLRSLVDEALARLGRPKGVDAGSAELPECGD